MFPYFLLGIAISRLFWTMLGEIQCQGGLVGRRLTLTGNKVWTARDYDPAKHKWSTTKAPSNVVVIADFVQRRAMRGKR